jgi:hypothetical protein
MYLYNGEISWGTFQYMVSDVQYGGKITDSLDVRLFRTYTKEWLTERTCQQNLLSRNTDNATRVNTYPDPVVGCAAPPKDAKMVTTL